MNKSIEITTTQNVTIEYELASLRERMLAFLLDAVIVMFGYWIFRVAVLALFPRPFEEEYGWNIALNVLFFVFFFLYHIIFEIWNVGQTPGKRAMNIKVVRLDGKDPEWSDVVLRSLLHLVDSIATAGVIGMLLVKTTTKSQRLGDMAANTTVIKLFSSRYMFRLEDILSISSLENYQPVYPQVRQLAEHDMLFIKNVLTRQQRYPNPAHENVIEDLVTHLMPILQLDVRPRNRVEFLRTILRDYIVLTR
jgi:uncharacterized RDD family membrane protein YckC